MKVTGYKPKENNIYVKVYTWLLESNFKLDLDPTGRKLP